MTGQSRLELIESLRNAYSIAGAPQKTEILNQVVNATGYHRKHATSLLNGHRIPGGRRDRSRSAKYGDEFKSVLTELWVASNRLCSKRLVALLPTLIPALEQHNRIRISDSMRAMLLQVSPATVDRMLRDKRKELASSLKKRRKTNSLRLNIPVRTGPWESPTPGFCEIDVVEHCGMSAAGSYLNTLTVTDIATGWTETEAIFRRTDENVLDALTFIRKHLPVRLCAIDSDNGTEFINHLLQDYCRDQSIAFTRSRPYKKNDQAHVEQKNGAVVRKLIGYARFETAQAHAVLTALYAVSRLYTNFFQPSFKLISRYREGAKIRRTYDRPKTPCQRMLESEHVSAQQKRRLESQFARLDPIRLLTEMERLQQELWSLSADDPNAHVQEVLKPNLAKPEKTRPKPPRPRKQKFEWLPEAVDSIMQIHPNIGLLKLEQLLKRKHGPEVPSRTAIVKRLRIWRQAHPEFSEHFNKQYLTAQAERSSLGSGYILDEAKELVRV